MSGVIKSVTKSFRKSNLLGKVAIAAAVWWTAGTAMAYFSAPSVTVGQAMAASTESMFSAVSAETAFVSPSTAAAGMTETAAATAAGAGTQAAELASQTEAFGAAGNAATNASLQYAGDAAVNAGVDTMSGIAAGTGGAGNVAASTAAKLAANGSMTNSQMMGMVLGGNAISGAAAADQAEEQRDYKDRVRRERGLGGYNYDGSYAGKPVIRSAMRPKSEDQAINAPEVVAPTVQAPGQPRPIPRRELAKLNRQGLVGSQQQGA